MVCTTLKAWIGFFSWGMGQRLFPCQTSVRVKSPNRRDTGPTTFWSRIWTVGVGMRFWIMSQTRWRGFMCIHFTTDVLLWPADQTLGLIPVYLDRHRQIDVVLLRPEPMQHDPRANGRMCLNVCWVLAAVYLCFSKIPSVASLLNWTSTNQFLFILHSHFILVEMLWFFIFNWRLKNFWTYKKNWCIIHQDLQTLNMGFLSTVHNCNFKVIVLTVCPFTPCMQN